MVIEIEAVNDFHEALRMDDEEYFRYKLHSALKIPPSLHNDTINYSTIEELRMNLDLAKKVKEHERNLSRTLC